MTDKDIRFRDRWPDKASRSKRSSRTCEPPTGVFAAYINANYDPNLVAINGPIAYGTNFQNAEAGDTSTPGEIIDVGGTGSQGTQPNPLGATELLFSVPMTTLQNFGTAEFTGTTPPESDQAPRDIVVPRLPAGTTSQIGIEGTAANVGSNFFTINNPDPVNKGATGTTTPVVFTVTHITPSDQSATVQFSTADGSAAAGQDYIATSGTLTFAGVEPERYRNRDRHGGGDRQLAVRAARDLLARAQQSDECRRVADARHWHHRHQQSTAGRVGGQRHRQRRPEPRLRRVAQFAERGDHDRGLCHRRSTSGNMATAGADYTPVSGTLTFAPGVTTQTIAVATLNDLLLEPTETFQMVLSNPVNATLGVASATGSILDVPPAQISGFVYVNTNNDGIKEKNESGVAGATVTVTQPGTSFSQTMVTAADGSYDFLLTPGTYNVSILQPRFLCARPRHASRSQ